MHNEESKPGGTTVATDTTATTNTMAKPAPVMDVVPPPTTTSDTGEAAVVDAPPEQTEYLTVSDDIAEQIAADSTMPPAPKQSVVNDEIPEMATPPAEAAAQSREAAEPSDLIKEELNRTQTPQAAVAKAPKVHNPASTAVTVTVFLMIFLAGLAVFAYMSSQ